LKKSWIGGSSCEQAEENSTILWLFNDLSDDASSIII